MNWLWYLNNPEWPFYLQKWKLTNMDTSRSPSRPVFKDVWPQRDSRVVEAGLVSSSNTSNNGTISKYCGKRFSLFA